MFSVTSSSLSVRGWVLWCWLKRAWFVRGSSRIGREWSEGGKNYFGRRGREALSRCLMTALPKNPLRGGVCWVLGGGTGSGVMLGGGEGRGG